MKNIIYYFRFTFIITFIFQFNYIFSQGSFQWEKSYGGSNKSRLEGISKTSDDCFIMVGGSYGIGGDWLNNSGDMDVQVLKIDSIGNKIWSKNFGGGGYDFGNSVTGNGQGSYFIVGNTNSSEGIPNFHGVPSQPNQNPDAYIVCIDNNGLKLWQMCYGGNGSEAFVNSVHKDNYLYVIGNTRDSYSNDVGGNYDTILHTDDVWICKINAIDGTLLKSIRFGGTKSEAAYKIIDGGNNTLLIVGNTISNDHDITTNLGYSDAFVLKIDTALNILNKKFIAGTQRDMLCDIIKTKDNGFLAYGTTENTNTASGNIPFVTFGSADLMLVKFDTQLNISWIKHYGTNYGESISIYNYGNFLIQMNDNGFLMGSQVSKLASFAQFPRQQGMMVFVKVDSTGNQKWASRYGTGNYTGGLMEYIRSIIPTNDGGIIVGGTSANGLYYTCPNTAIDSTGFWYVFKLNNTMDINDLQSNNNQILVYPNPTNSTLTLNSTNNQNFLNGLLQIYNIQGKIVKESKISKNEISYSVDVSYLSKGLYMGRIIGESGESMSFKFVKE